MNTKYPPKVLVETWFFLINQNDDYALQQHARDMLTGAFGDMHKALYYINECTLQSHFDFGTGSQGPCTDLNQCPSIL